MKKRKPESKRTQRKRDLAVLTDVDPDDPLDGYKPDNLEELEGLFQYLRRKEERILEDVSRVVFYVEHFVPHLKKDLTRDLRFIKRAWTNFYMYAQGRIQAWMVRHTFAHEVYSLTLGEQTRLYDEEVEVADLPPEPGEKKPDVFYIDCRTTLGSPFRRAQLISPLGRFRTVQEQIKWYNNTYGPEEADKGPSAEKDKRPAMEPKKHAGEIKIQSLVPKNTYVSYGTYERAYLKAAEMLHGRPVKLVFADEEDE